MPPTIETAEDIKNIQEQNNNNAQLQDGIWVFGYGSLIWKPPIHYEAKQIGYIKNYVRRFWQHSEDHRGTPEKPGRVVTLIPFDEWKEIESIEGHDRVTWGVAFKIPSDDVEATRAYLDHREKNGYTVHTVDVYSPEDDQVPAVRNALVYIGTTDNEAYVGPAPYDAIAQQIYETYGPSGWNAEYLLNLAEALREISPGVRDDHVFELEARVRKLIDASQQKTV
ncbi:putative glutathione-specific gamma-glutamylcyclotransferase 2 [Choanephora cucurbitarum]|uniref:glutathione-specific gamma-glutamylcyclotransferase n=1 Tax=Choanephora cucurbitarum TaxID=101091 RepID=A0A1C7N3E8_9FUNG|nr:putative glutathione-specific gamma-glutamylcyclotransferase 2 [Choanephora cucurbitarum]